MAASAPTRTLGRRKLLRNRFTIDTDIVFDGEPEQELASPQEPGSDRLQQEDKPNQLQSELAGDTDRWVEEQFDLEEYEDREEVKETDILSDEDDESCQTPGARSAEADLEAPVMALSLVGEEKEESESLKSPTGSETHDLKLVDTGKQSGANNDDVADQKHQTERGEIWVRRDPSGSSPA